MVSSSFFFTSLLWFLVSFSYIDAAAIVVKTIVVDQSGHGDFNTVESAIYSVPDGNRNWIRIHLKRGVYREKVTVPAEKEFILLEGEGPKWTTIEWGDHYAVEASNSSMPGEDALATATFALNANNFVAQGILFLNTYQWDPSALYNRALAASVGGDKASFYNCSFKSFQDTLCDYKGRHYFKDCWIEGAIDFIFGYGQSMYEHCVIWTLAMDNRGTAGYITAQGRGDPTESGGYVFKYSTVTGPGKAYLGRAYGAFSTVVFY